MLLRFLMRGLTALGYYYFSPGMPWDEPPESVSTRIRDSPERPHHR